MQNPTFIPMANVNMRRGAFKYVKQINTILNSRLLQVGPGYPPKDPSSRNGLNRNSLKRKHKYLKGKCQPPKTQLFRCAEAGRNQFIYLTAPGHSSLRKPMISSHLDDCNRLWLKMLADSLVFCMQMSNMTGDGLKKKCSTHATNTC